MAASPQLLEPDALIRLLSDRSLDPAGSPPLSTGMPELDAALPDGGLPSSAVVELCGPSGMGRVTGVALSACAAAQRRVRESEGQDGWCAWIDAAGSLYAPGLARAGVDLDRLLVVRPDPADIARVAVRLVQSRVFAVVVIDRASVPGAELAPTRATRWNTVVRRLALAAEQAETSVLLLSTTAAAQRQTLPVAMRLELDRPGLDRLRLRVAKDKRGRLRGPQSIPLPMTG
jgi:recombination protein RecA